VFILKRLRRFLLVSVDSKDVYVEIRYLADGLPVAGLGRSMLRPYVCSEIERRENTRQCRHQVIELKSRHAHPGSKGF
jgi:hypothetical protein